jgi:hypothetical protein
VTNVSELPVDDVTTPRHLVDEMLRLSRLLDVAQEELKKASRDWARLENEYRKAKANAYLASSGTVDARKAAVDKATDQERHDAHLADALRVAALENVRNRRAQLSALQSIANAVKSEVELSGRYTT